MDLTTVLLLAALVAVVVLLARRHRRAAAAPKPFADAAKETYTQVGVSRRYAQNPLPLPGDASPLTPLLRKAIDPAVPMSAAAEALPHDATEVRGVLERVLARVNAATPGLNLALVKFDNVRKGMDTYKNLKYEADMDVYSKARGFGSKVAAAADVTPGGTLYVRSLKVHAAQHDDGTGAQPFDGALAAQEHYAAFEPAVRYE